MSIFNFTERDKITALLKNWTKFIPAVSMAFTGPVSIPSLIIPGPGWIQGKI